MEREVLQSEFDFDAPPRASASTIAAAAEWLREAVSRWPARQRAESDDGIGTASPMSGFLRANIAPLEDGSFCEVSLGCPETAPTSRRARRKKLDYATLRGPRQGPPDLKAAVLTFPARLLKYVNERWDGNAPRVYRQAHVSRSVYSRIVSSNRSKVTKETAMKFAIGLQLGRREADLLMHSAGFSFSDSIPWDMAFVYCIENQIWNLEDLNEILDRNGFEPMKLD